MNITNAISDIAIINPIIINIIASTSIGLNYLSKYLDCNPRIVNVIINTYLNIPITVSKQNNSLVVILFTISVIFIFCLFYCFTDII